MGKCVVFDGWVVPGGKWKKKKGCHIMGSSKWFVHMCVFVLPINVYVLVEVLLKKVSK